MYCLFGLYFANLQIVFVFVCSGENRAMAVEAGAIGAVLAFMMAHARDDKLFAMACNEMHNLCCRNGVALLLTNVGDV